VLKTTKPRPFEAAISQICSSAIIETPYLLGNKISVPNPEAYLVTQQLTENVQAKLVDSDLCLAAYCFQFGNMHSLLKFGKCSGVLLFCSAVSLISLKFGSIQWCIVPTYGQTSVNTYVAYTHVTHAGSCCCRYVVCNNYRS
jgi:hypothetical protein